MWKFRVSLLVLGVLVLSSGAMANTYYIWDDWGGTYSDAEKSPTNSDDDLLCWAGAASNILEWTGWGQVGGMTTTDDMFAHFQAHFSDQGGNPYYAWDWWFDGTNTPQGWSGWAQEDVDGGGGFYPSLNINDYRVFDSNDANALANIDAWLHDGYGLSLWVGSSTVAHLITVWGYEYDDQGNYTGIYVTDSDDDKYDTTPEDELRYYDVTLSGGRWYLQNYYGVNDIYISEVIGLQSQAVPEPATILMLGALGAGMAAARRAKRKKTD